MYNLIKKDIKMQKMSSLFLLPVLLFYLFLNTPSIWIGVIFCIALIMNAFANDEKSNIHILLNSLPYTRKEIVSSKYISTFIFIFMVLITLFFGNLIIYKELLDWKSSFFIISSVMVFTSFSLPFSYKFKSQYLFIATIVAGAVYLFIFRVFFYNLHGQIAELVHTILTLENTLFYLLMIVATVILYVLSWLLSIRIYSKKVF